MRYLTPILADILLCVSAIGFGSLFHKLIPERFTKIDRCAVQLLAGLGTLGTLLFLIGQVWFTQTAVVIVLLIGVVLCLVRTAKMAGGGKTEQPKIAVPVLPAIIIAIVLGITVIGGLAEPTGDIKMDAIAYHYLGPRVWLREGLIRPVADECQTSFPAIVETQYAALMSIGGQRAPNFFSVIALSSLLLMTASLAFRAGLDATGVWWAMALVATMPVVYRGVFGGFIDAVLAGFVLAAARIGLDAVRGYDYVAFGIFCGFAIGTKYTALVSWPLLVCSVFLMATWMRRERWNAVLKYLAISCSVAAAVGAAWYIRNWILLGCPIYPPLLLEMRWLHARYFTPETAQQFIQFVKDQEGGMGHGLISFLLLPYNLTYHTSNFVNGAGGIGVTPLALAPLGLFSALRNKFATMLGLYALLQTAGWFVTNQEARYVTPVYIVLAIFAVLGWEYIVKTTPRMGRFLAGLLVAVSILYGLTMIGRARETDIRATISSSFEIKRMAEEDPFREGFAYLNENSSVTEVLILDPRVPPYYLTKNYVKPIGRHEEETVPDATDLSSLLEKAADLHISHVWDVRWPGKSFHLPEAPPGLTLVFQRYDQRIYRVGSSRN